MSVTLKLSDQSDNHFRNVVRMGMVWSSLMVGVVWLVVWFLFRFRSWSPQSEIAAWSVQGVVALSILLGMVWLYMGFHWKPEESFRHTVSSNRLATRSFTRGLIFTLAPILIWQSFWILDRMGILLWEPTLSRVGLGVLFCIGLCWTIYFMEEMACHYSFQDPANEEDLGPHLSKLIWTSLLFTPWLVVQTAKKPAPLRKVALWILSAWIVMATFLWPATQIIAGLLSVEYFGWKSTGIIPLLACILSASPILFVLAIGIVPLLGITFLFQPMFSYPKAVYHILQPGSHSAWKLAFLTTWETIMSVGKWFAKPLSVGILFYSLIQSGWYWLNRKDRGSHTYVWNPFHPRAWYYGQRQRKLNQSVTGFLGYSVTFCVAMLIITSLHGCQEIYEMPAGGGEQAQITPQVQVKKVIKKKFIVNPFSFLNIKIPDIDDVQLQLNDLTKHRYKVGYGSGTGAGFAGGTQTGKVRFIRLEYAGGDWNQDFGVGADLNMLLQYNIRTSQKVAERTEARAVSALRNFPVGKSPPFVFMTGQKNISLSKSEIRILREYLIDKHGMLFCDNGGSSQFHTQFLAMMRKVLPNVRQVRIPLDDRIHSIPYKIPFLPYVAPHGGKDALGWKVDGRWVCYYHPGDIADAWADGHAGVKPAVWEACYQLGTNVIFYAHVEYSKWLEARKNK